MSVRFLVNKYYHISINNVLNDVIIDQLNHTYQERKKIACYDYIFHTLIIRIGLNGQVEISC